MKSILPVLILIIIFQVSCAKHEKMPDEEIMHKLLTENPDSLAYLLEEKINPSLLSEEDRINYIWWLASAHSKQYRSLINDSLIHKVLQCHKQTGSPLLLSTYQLAAEQAKSSGDVTKEETLLNEALVLAEERKDSTIVLNLASKLGYIYNGVRDSEKIDKLIKTTKKYASWDVDTYLTLTKLYNRSGKIDSIGKYASLGIKAAIARKRPMEEYQLTRSYIEYLNLSAQSPEALSVLRDLEHKMPMDGGIVGNEIKFNYITTWIALGRYDSAQVYIDYFDPILKYFKTKNPTETYVIETVLDLFKTVIHTKQGKIFTTHDLGTINQLVEGSRESIKAEKEKMLAQNKLQRDKLNLQIEKGNLQRRLLWGAIGIMLITAILVFVYQRKLLRKEHNIQKIKEQLRIKSMQIAENESIINQNEQLIRSLNSQVGENEDIRQELDTLLAENEKIKEKNGLLQSDIQSFTNSITEKDKELNFFEELSLQNARLMERDQFLTIQLIKRTPILNGLDKNPKYIEEMQWHEIIHTVDQLFDGFSVRLHIDYPTLTEEDIRYCCLFKLRLSNSVISSLMGISPSSVTKRKQRIKEKINQHLPDDLTMEKPLEVYLWNYN